MRYYFTRKINVNGSTRYVSLPSDWGFRKGDLVVMGISSSYDELDWDFIITKRVSRMGNAVAISIPASFGYEPGDWVTIVVEMKRMANDDLVSEDEPE